MGTGPIPEPPADNSPDTMSRDELRQMLAALGIDLPINTTDVTQTAEELAKLQQTLQDAIDASLGGPDRVGPPNPQRVKNLSDMQHAVQAASTKLQTYAYTAFTDAGKLPQDLSVSQLGSLFGDGLITRDTVAAKLGSLHYSPDDAELLIKGFEKNAPVGDKAPTLSASTLQQLVKSGVMGYNEAKSRLTGDLKYSGHDADLLLALSKPDGPAATTGFSSTTIQGMLADKQLTRDGAKMRLMRDQGYSDVDAEAVLKLWEEGDKAKAEADAAKANPGQQLNNRGQRVDQLQANQAASDAQAKAAATAATTPVGQLQQTFTPAYRAQMAPALPNQPRLPTASELTQQYSYEYDSALNGISGLSPDEQMFAQGPMKSMLMSRYTGTLAGYNQAFIDDRAAGGNGLQPTNPILPNAVANKVARDGTLAATAAQYGVIQSSVMRPAVSASSFVGTHLTAGEIKNLYAGSSRGAGQGSDKGATQAILREGAVA